MRIRDNKFKAKVSKEIQNLFPLLENGKIVLCHPPVFNFEDVVNAHKRIDMGTHIGKIVLNLKDIVEEKTFNAKSNSQLVNRKYISFVQQISEFVGLHPLEVQAIADGIVSSGMLARNPMKMES